MYCSHTHTHTHVTPTHLPNTCHPNPKRAVVKAPASLLCASQSIRYLSSPSSLLSRSFPLPPCSSALTHQQKIFTTQIRSGDERFFLILLWKSGVIKHRESRRWWMEIMNMKRVSFFFLFYLSPHKAAMLYNSSEIIYDLTIFQCKLYYNIMLLFLSLLEDVGVCRRVCVWGILW